MKIVQLFFFLMKALVLVAHGSRLDAANREIVRLLGPLRDKAGDDFDRVMAAFLELAEPSIPNAIQQCVDNGAKEIILLPYFLASGKHVTSDIPAAADKKRAQYPHVNIRLLDYFGKSPQMTDMLLSHLYNRSI